MGNQLSQSMKKLLIIDNLTQKIQSCEQLSQRQCPIYGTLHRISYKNIQLQIGKSPTTQTPDQLSLHHIIQPNILLIPPHCMLENYKIDKYDSKLRVLEFMYEICQLGEKIDVGFSHHRVAYSYFMNRWCVMGDTANGLWNYQYAIKSGNDSSGVYFSPELMYAFSKDKLYPKIDIKQSDVFIFAVMLLEIITGERLQSEVYNFVDCQMKLGPILEALIGIEEGYGKDVYELLVKMLELQPESRFNFTQIKQEVEKIIKSQQGCYLSPNIIKFNSLTPTPNVKPKIDSYEPSPQITKVQEQTRGRSPGVIRKNLPFTDRENGKKSFSPIKPGPSEVSAQTEQKNVLIYQDRHRRLSNGYKITPNRVKIWEGMQKQRPKVEPFGLRFDHGPQQAQTRVDRKSFSKLKAIRY